MSHEEAKRIAARHGAQWIGRGTLGLYTLYRRNGAGYQFGIMSRCGIDDWRNSRVVCTEAEMDEKFERIET